VIITGKEILLLALNISPLSLFFKEEEQKRHSKKSPSLKRGWGDVHVLYFPKPPNLTSHKPKHPLLPNPNLHQSTKSVDELQKPSD